MVAVAKITTPRAGHTIGGKYRLLRRIGSGGMADVFEAVHLITERLVAVKVMHPAIARDRREATRRVFREAALCSAIDHPGIVDVLDAGEDKDTGAAYIVFELLEGEDLETALSESFIPLSDLIQITVQILEALAAIHEGGILHRDVKPANVFIARSSGRWTVKLLDFGIALEIDDGECLENDRSTVVGTVEYMSPEQALGEAIDGRADLYAVGVLLFRAITRRLPFVAPDYRKLMVKIASEDAPPIATLRPDLPPALAALVDRALQRDRDQRFANAQEMARALRAIDPLGGRGPTRARRATETPTRTTA